MAMTWCEPRVEIQKFVANEYVATCRGFSTGVIITTEFSGGVVTDGRTNPVWDWQGVDKGFNDDHFDYLNASEVDVLPTGGGEGWYSDTIDKEILAGMGIVFHDNSPMPQIFTSSSSDPKDWYGNHDKEVNDVRQTVYYWGNWPEVINSTNHEDFGVGPNAS